MKTIYRTRKGLDNIPRDKQVVYIEDWAIVASIVFALSFVAFMWASLNAGELVGYGQHTWPQALKDTLLYLNLALSGLAGWSAAQAVVKPHRLKQTRGAQLHEDDRIGGDGFQAMKTLLDEELKSQPGKAPPLVLAAPRGVEILRTDSRSFALCAPLSDDRSRTHILVVGGTGTGKSLTLKPILHQAIRRGHKLVILDKKGEYTEEIEERRIALFGLHDRRQLQWHIARDIRTIPDAQQFLEGLIPVDASQPYWGTSARLIGTALFAHLIQTKPGAWTLKDFEELCSVPPEEMSPFVRKAYSEAEAILKGEGQALTSVLGNLAAFTAPLKTFGKEWDGSSYPLFSFSEWLEDPSPERNCLIFQSGSKYGSLNDPLIRGCLTFMAGYVDSPMFHRDSKEKPRSLWFFCDEFQSFGKLDTFTKILLERGRDKGARMVIGVQDVSQLNELYGQDFVKFLMSNVGTSILAGANQGETAETFSKNLGQLSFNKTHTTHTESGKSVTEQEHQEDVLNTAEIIGKLGFKNGRTRALYRFTRSPDAYIVHQPLIAYPRITKPTVEADWVLGIPKAHKAAPGAAATAEAPDRTPSVNTTSTRAQEQQLQQMPSEELPEELDDLPPGYEDFPEFEDEEDAELYYHQASEADEMAAPVASLAGVSGVEHAIALVDLLASDKPKLKASKSIADMRSQIKQELQSLTTKNNMIR